MSTRADDSGAGDETDGPTAAFRRLLKEAGDDRQARTDALTVLVQRTVFVATWPVDPDSGIRTLTSSSGDTAIPVFSTVDVLKEAALRFGWTNPDGSLSWRELGAREALRRAMARGVQFVVVDIGCDHSLEFTRAEFEPMIAVPPRRESVAPSAAGGKGSSTANDAAKRSSRPPALAYLSESGERPRSAHPPARSVTPSPGAVKPAMASSVSSGAIKAAPLPGGAQPFASERYASAPPRSPSSDNMPAQKRPSAPPGRKRSLTPDPARLTGPLVDITGMAFSRLDAPISDDVLDTIADALRRFPEVEWASVVMGNKAGHSQVMIVLRVEPAYRARLPEVNRFVRLVGEDAGKTVGVAVADDPKQIRTARELGVVFYPWKKTARPS